MGHAGSSSPSSPTMLMRRAKAMRHARNLSSFITGPCIRTLRYPLLSGTTSSRPSPILGAASGILCLSRAGAVPQAPLSSSGPRLRPADSYGTWAPDRCVDEVVFNISPCERHSTSAFTGLSTLDERCCARPITPEMVREAMDESLSDSATRQDV
jgi:hypothetical protein